MPRQRYGKHPDSVMRRIFESDEPYDLARQLRIPKSTIASMFQRGTPSRKPRGGARGSKLTAAHSNFLIAQIETKPDLTLKELTEKLADQFDVSVRADNFPPSRWPCFHCQGASSRGGRR